MCKIFLDHHWTIYEIGLQGYSPCSGSSKKCKGLHFTYGDYCHICLVVLINNLFELCLSNSLLALEFRGLRFNVAFLSIFTEPQFIFFQRCVHPCCIRYMRMKARDFCTQQRSRSRNSFTGFVHRSRKFMTQSEHHFECS